MVGWSVVYRVHNFGVIFVAIPTLSNVREVLADLHMCRHGSDSEEHTRAVLKLPLLLSLPLLLLPRIVQSSLVQSRESSCGLQRAADL
jgi:hypothetical protein